MGREVTSRTFTREDRRLFRQKVLMCVDALERMLREGAFADDVDPPRPMLGMEIEFNLSTPT